MRGKKVGRLSPPRKDGNIGAKNFSPHFLTENPEGLDKYSP
jgi:hypothetical protein